MPATSEQIAALGEPTPLSEIKKRPIFNKEKTKVGELDYVDARYVMDRLDAEVGPTNWQDSFRPAEGGGIVGRIGIYCEMGDGVPGQWVWKEDVGTESTIEAEKGAHSDAFKRAAVKWGIARDLYDTRDGQTGRGLKPAVGQSSTQTAARTGRPVNFPVHPNDAPWICPEHQAVVAWPAGVAANGRKYDAFYACPKGRECPNRPPPGLKVKPEHLVARNDDLPF